MCCEPAPDHAVVTCFQRVMMLGFLGSFRSLNDPSARNSSARSVSMSRRSATHKPIRSRRKPYRMGNGRLAGVMACAYWPECSGGGCTLAGTGSLAGSDVADPVAGSREMSPAQQCGLALWAALLSAVVCLVFCRSPDWFLRSFCWWCQGLS